MSADTTRRLVLLRHGLTTWNAERRWQGHADVELTETGVLQAKAAAETLALLRPTFVLGSDLSRAATTAQHVAAAAGLTPTYDPRLREIHIGILSGLTTAEVHERFGTGPYDHSQHGGESDAAVQGRVVAALDEAARRLSPGETAIVVGHGTSLKLGLIGFLRWPAASAETLGALANCGWIELEETAPSSSPAPLWRLTAYNRIASIS